MSGRRNGGVDSLPTLKPQVARAVEESLLPVVQARAGVPTRGSGTDAQNTVVKEGLQSSVLWLKFCGVSNRMVAQKLALSKDAVNRFVKSDYFIQLYDSNRSEMLGRVDEASRERLQEVTLEALEVKIDLMRNTHSPALRNKIASELLDLGLDAAKAVHGGASAAIVAVYERAKRRKNADGSVTTEKVRVTGPPDRGFDAGGNGSPPWVDGGPSETSGENGSPEAPSGSGSEGMDEGADSESAEPPGGLTDNGTSRGGGV